MSLSDIYLGIVWLFASALTGYLARDKGRREGLWVLLALFLSPVVGLLALAAASDKRRPPAPRTP